MRNVPYYYPDQGSAERVREEGQMCDGYSPSSKPCKCCGKACGFLKSIHKAHSIRLYTTPVLAGYDESLDLCWGCLTRLIADTERLLGELKELASELG